MEVPLERIPWRRNQSAVEIGFEFYLDLLERRISGEEVSLVQEVSNFFERELGIELRETQARGLMHKSSSPFVQYVKRVIGDDFNPASEHWMHEGIEELLEWRSRWTLMSEQEAADLRDVPDVPATEMDRATELMRKTLKINRIIRDNALCRFLKGLYDSRCQICEFIFALPSGRNLWKPITFAHSVAPTMEWIMKAMWLCCVRSTMQCSTMA